MHELLAYLDAAVRGGFAALAVTAWIAWSTRRELRECQRRERVLGANLTKSRVAVARLYGLVKRRMGELDPIPDLAELLTDRRTDTRS